MIVLAAAAGTPMAAIGSSCLHRHHVLASSIPLVSGLHGAAQHLPVPPGLGTAQNTGR